MNETVHETLADTLDYLMSLVRDGVRPEDAKAGLRPLQTRHPDVEMQLIWEEESYDRSIHYDALLNLSGNGTVSLSYCGDRGMPWPLRGIHRWSDADLVRVNNNTLTVDQAVACLDFIWDEARITDRLVNVCLIQEELDRHPVDLSDEELQMGLDGFRRTQKLYKAEDTLRWMERRGISHSELERLVGSQLKVAKLRDRLVADRVQEYFAGHAEDFETACIARILLPDEASALEMFERIQNGETSFYDAAQCCFVAARQSSKMARNFFTVVSRLDTPAEIRKALFDAKQGSVLKPVRGEDGYAIVQLLSIFPATLDQLTRNKIERMLFDTWLEKRREASAIEWLWGNASKTASSSRTDSSRNLSLVG